MRYLLQIEDLLRKVSALVARPSRDTDNSGNGICALVQVSPGTRVPFFWSPVIALLDGG